jgi:hypothetical protein
VTVLVVLRLAAQALAGGTLAGEAELVATGEKRVVESAEELLAFLRERAERHPRRRAGAGDDPERRSRARSARSARRPGAA